MSSEIKVYSEIGTLKKVLLHRLGHEIEALIPENFGRLLFDDIPYLKVAQQEHDEFAALLRENGAEVVYFAEEAAKAMENPAVRAEFTAKFIEESGIASAVVKEAVTDYLSGMTPQQMIEKVIAGVKKEDIHLKVSDSLSAYIESEDLYYTDPMPNCYFTRDPSACVGDGISIHHMSTKTRRREALLLEYIVRYNRHFAPENAHVWYDYEDPPRIEGGDILVLSNEIVAVGLSSRTNAPAIEHFTENLLSQSGFKKVLVFDIPKSRAYMHLDTVFTMVDYEKFTIHPEIEGPLRIFELTLDKDGKARFKSREEELIHVLREELKLPAVELLRCGGGDYVAAQREQWNDGSNTLAIAPGVVVTYERNVVTNDLLNKKGVKVLTMTSGEVSRGRGGPRCMSCPMVRELL